MLVLSRRVGEEIIIGENIRVTVVAVQGGRVRIGIAAPSAVSVDRKEVFDRRGDFRGSIEQSLNNALRFDDLPVLHEAGQNAVGAF